MAGTGTIEFSGGAGNDELAGGDGDDSYVFGLGFGQDRLVDGDGRNSITLEAPIELRHIWLARVGDDLVVSIIGTTDKITVEDYFSAQNPSRVRSIATSTHTLFLGSAGPLIEAMTPHQPASLADVPTAVSDVLLDYWHLGDSSAPTAEPIELTIDEDEPVTVSDLGVVDPDQNIESYVLGTAAAHGLVDVNDQTGEFTYTPAANYHGADSFTIIVTDADDNSVEIAVTVTVAAVNDDPGAIGVAGGASLAVAEMAGAGTAVGQYSTATDVDGDALTYTLVDNAGGRFAITESGLLSVATAGSLDHETGSSHVIRVRVEDGHGGSSEPSTSRSR